MNLRSALQGCSSSQLSRIAAAWTLQVEAGTLRRELVEAVAVRIEAEVQDAAVWATLDSLERQVLGLLVRAHGRHESDLLCRRLARAADAGIDPDDTIRAIDAAAGRLVERGLLFRVYDAGEQRQGVYLVMPDEVLSAAERLLDHSLELPGDPPPDLPNAGGGEAGAWQPVQIATVRLDYDLFVLASALRREVWSAVSRGLARRPGLTVSQIIGRLRQQVGEGPGDPGRRWRFILWLAQRAGWISRDSWPLPDDDAIERLLANPALLPIEALAAGPAGDTSKGAITPDRARPGKRQADALQFLSEIDPSTWWSAPDLAAWLAREIGEEEAGSGPGGRRGRGDQTAQQIGRWLAGRWYWLGLVAWGRNESGWSTVAPVAAVRTLASGSAGDERPTRRPCLLTDTLRLEAPADADLAILYRAERYLAFNGTSHTEHGVRRYSLTPATFERGLRLGGDADALRGLLERLGQQALPLEWHAAIDRWSRSSERLRLTARLLLSSDRVETLAEALRVKSAGEAVIEQASPNHAFVVGDKVAALLTDLAQAGLPVEIDPAVRLEPADAGRSAALASGVAETAWVALEVLRRLAPEVVGEQRDLHLARGRLEAVLGPALLEALGRRAATISAAISERRGRKARRRVV